MSDRIRTPAIEQPNEDSPRSVARAARQIKNFLENPERLASYIQQLIDDGLIDTGVTPLGDISGEVTQETSKSTGVSVNAPSGAIIMHGASLGAGASVAFDVTNSFVQESDVVVLTPRTLSSYRVEPARIQDGGFRVRVTNTTGGALGEALTINFLVLRGGG